LKWSKIEALCLGLIWLSAVRLPACGPDFPNNLLDRGDQAVLDAPAADFTRELERMKLVTPRTRAVPPAEGQNYEDQSSAVEMTDLAAALKREKISSELATVILQAHLAERMKLNDFLARRETWNRFNAGYLEQITNGEHPPPNTNPPPVIPNVAVTPGLPREFADYFAGAIQWHQDGGWAAGECWARVLALPAAERHFKSTWAAFMLAKFHAHYLQQYPQDTGDEAAGYYQQVRALAKVGFADSAGLAVASLGGEAQIYLHRKDYERALDLYLEQFAAGDDSAVDSLQVVVRQILHHGDAGVLRELAARPNARRVITAYLISHRWSWENDQTKNEETTQWLGAVEAAGVKDLDSAEELALAAYQAGQWDIAQRWIKRAPASPVAQWLQVKLLLRAGKVSQAAALLAQVTRRFPLAANSTNALAGLKDNLTVERNDEENTEAAGQVLGELGVFKLARREYAEALDALLRAGFWMDAAYVAERVLTVEELKKYVDRNWPAVVETESSGAFNAAPVLDGLESTARPKPVTDRRSGARARSQSAEPLVPRRTGFTPEMTVRDQIRYLLARRLARLNLDAGMEWSASVPGAARSAGKSALASSNPPAPPSVAAPGDGRTPVLNPEARAYYPAEWQPQFDALRQALLTGRDESLTSTQRAGALLSAAFITRTNGMELLGTEVEPDWYVNGGDYQIGVSVASRTNESTQLLASTPNSGVPRSIMRNPKCAFIIVFKPPIWRSKPPR
jgi:hypothetical protein